MAQDGGKSVTILLDGYDELPSNLRQKSFIIDLLQHKVLPACFIVISSHPHASTHHRDNISCQVEILDFSEQDQQHFIEHSLIKQYLKCHSAISNLCFIPFNTPSFCSCIRINRKHNYTGLYNLFICLIYIPSVGILPSLESF